MIRDGNLEWSSQWVTRIGPDIGGPNPFVAPTSYGFKHPAVGNDWMEVYISGGAYTDMMVALQRPILPVFNAAAIELAWEFDLYTDVNTPVQAQALETDIRLCDAAGYNYNASLQLNYQSGGQIQISNAKGGWSNTGLIPGKYAPNVPYHVDINYLFDTVEHTVSVQSMEINYKAYVIPLTMQKVPAQLLKWVPGVYLQVQSDLASTGGAFSYWMKNISLDWL
jgi:hypothetical protein